MNNQFSRAMARNFQVLLSTGRKKVQNSLGFPYLAEGNGFVVVAMGRFGLAEISRLTGEMNEPGRSA